MELASPLVVGSPAAVTLTTRWVTTSVVESECRKVITSPVRYVAGLAGRSMTSVARWVGRGHRPGVHDVHPVALQPQHRGGGGRGRRPRRARRPSPGDPATRVAPPGGPTGVPAHGGTARRRAPSRRTGFEQVLSPSGSVTKVVRPDAVLGSDDLVKFSSGAEVVVNCGPREELVKPKNEMSGVAALTVVHAGLQQDRVGRCAVGDQV